jgi:predicted O-methyltransferase YrrM
MLDFNDPVINEYILKHSGGEDDVLKELTRQTHLREIYPRMLSGPLQGNFLYMMVKMLNPLSILEIGTYTGYSAIWMARALQDEGRLITIEKNDELESTILEFFKKAEVDRKIALHIGNAVNIIGKISCSFDMVFIDADKEEYCTYYDLVFPKLKKGGVIIADNVLWSGKVVQDIPKTDKETKAIVRFNQKIANDARIEKIILPVRDGLSIIRKI